MDRVVDKYSLGDVEEILVTVADDELSMEDSLPRIVKPSKIPSGFESKEEPCCSGRHSRSSSVATAAKNWFRKADN